MFCGNCGSQLKEDAKFCPNCGTRVMSEEEVKHTIDCENKYKDVERFAPMVTLLPLVMAVLGIVISVLQGLLWRIPFMWQVARLVAGLYVLLKGLALIVALAATVGLVYIALAFKDRAKINTWIAPAAALLTVISCMGIVFGWSWVALLFGIAVTVLGLEFLARIVIGKKPMDSQLDPEAAVATYKKYYEDYKEKAQAEKGVEKTQTVQTMPEVMPQQPGNPQYLPDLNNFSDFQDSQFDGSGLELLGYGILTMLVSLITCGIGAPWMICKVYSWRMQHTVINGRRLTFTGSGASLLGHWILWEILTVITCGLYGFFAHVALRKWELNHTYIAGEPIIANGNESYFDGSSLAYFGYSLLSSLLLGITCGLSFPWVMTMLQKWETKHEVINRRRLAFDGTGMGFLGEFLIILLLSVVTCGIYLPWGTVRWMRYVTRHKHFVN